MTRLAEGRAALVQTIGGSICGPSTALLSTVGTDGHIYGSIANRFTSTWWYPNGRHNTFRDLDLKPEDAAAFIAAQKKAH